MRGRDIRRTNSMATELSDGSKKRFWVSEVRARWCSAEAKRNGALAHLGMTINGGLRMDEGLYLRRTADGRYTVSFPARIRGSFKRFFVRPLDDATRLEIEEQVIAELRRQGFLK
jgi:hypothetical protein